MDEEYEREVARRREELRAMWRREIGNPPGAGGLALPFILIGGIAGVVGGLLVVLG